MRDRQKRRRQRLWLERIVIVVLALLLVVEAVYLLRHRNVPGAGVTAPEWVEVEPLPINPYSRPGTPLRQINGVVVHYVGNPATSAEANRSCFAGLALTGETYASAHFRRHDPHRGLPR